MPDHHELEQAIRVLNRVRRNWMRRPGVSAVDVGFPIKDNRMWEDRVALRAHVVRKKNEDELGRDELFPTEEDGIRVDVMEVDYGASVSSGATARDEGGGGVDGDAVSRDPRRFQRLSPVLGGVSVGNPRIAAGTLGAVVWDRTDGTPHILSNWHVLAGNDAFVEAGGCPSPRAGQSLRFSGVDRDGLQTVHQTGAAPSSQALAGLQPFYQALAGLQPFYQALAGLQPFYQSLTGLEPFYQLLASLEPFYQSASAGRPFYQAAALGEPIYQPGRFDGGTAADTVAHLTRARLDKHMDAAIARLTGMRPYNSFILGIGLVSGETRPRPGMRVKKSGRTSGVTHGRIDGLSLSTRIEWGSERHYFTDQIHIVPLDPWPAPVKDFKEVSEGGDSGALWVEEDTNRAVGLHFAGDIGGMAENEHALANPIHRVEEALDISFTPDPCARESIVGRPDEATLLRLLANLGGGRRAADLASLVQAVTGRGDEGSAGSRLSRQELEALRAVIDVVLAATGG